MYSDSVLYIYILILEDYYNIKKVETKQTLLYIFLNSCHVIYFLGDKMHFKFRLKYSPVTFRDYSFYFFQWYATCGAYERDRLNNNFYLFKQTKIFIQELNNR